MDMIIRNRTARTGGIVCVCVAALWLAACDNEYLSGEEPDKSESTELRFVAALAGNPSTKAIEKPLFMEGTAFPFDGTYTFGMFVADEAGNALSAGSDENMKAILTRNVIGTNFWEYTKSDGITPLSLKAEPDQRIDIKGYYPWVAGATSAAVPFDLTGGMAGKQELLYLSSPSSLWTMTPEGLLPLTFSHAYSRVKVKLTKLTDTGVGNVSVSSVSIDNRHGNLHWVKNRGTIDPRTGEVNNAGYTAGPVTVNCTPAEDVPLDGSLTTLPLEFEFLVPAFMSADVQDSDVVIRVMAAVGSGEQKALTFPLRRNNLDGLATDGNVRGFQKGYINTYNIIYNNATMILELSDWQSNPVSGSLGEPVGSYSPDNVILGTTAEENYMRISRLDKDDHLYHSYLGEVAGGNNGIYVVPLSALSAHGNFYTEWNKLFKTGVTGNSRTQEAVNPELMFAKKEAAAGALLAWREPETGVLTARQSCIEHREGGYKDWRLPRINELQVLASKAKLNRDLIYWSGTENTADLAFAVEYGQTFMTPTIQDKTAWFKVRCVRDATKP